MKTSEWLILLIALYGAILSTVVFWRERQKDRRTLQVSCDVSFGVSHVGATTGRYITIEAVNNGHRPITIIQAGLLTNTKEIVIQTISDINFYPLPKKLEDGDPVVVHFSWDEIVNAAKDKKIFYTKAFVKDAEGKVYSAQLPPVLKEIGVAI